MSKLKEIQIKNIKGTGKIQKLYDGGGLYLAVSTAGGKSWRIDFRHEGSFKTITLGKYPQISLTEARLQREMLKLDLAKGINPLETKKKEKNAPTIEDEAKFGNLALLWIEQKQNDKSEKHKYDINSKLERFIYPTFKDRDIRTITPKEMLEVLRKIEARGIFETCKKTLGICNQIFSFAIGEGILEYNICLGLSKQLKTIKREHYGHTTDRKELGKLLNDIDSYPHGILVKFALQISPHVFVRPNELISATWSEINFDEAIWVIPAERMKVGKKHLVPLSKQVIKLFSELKQLTGNGEFLFANWNKGNKPITIDGVRLGLRRLGYINLTTHGFRHTASTMLNELGYNSDWIEKQLAHTGDNGVRATYNHAQYLNERKQMMQEWSDYLDKLKLENTLKG